MSNFWGSLQNGISPNFMLVLFFYRTAIIENIFMNRLIPNNSLYLQLEIIFKV